MLNLTPWWRSWQHHCMWHYLNLFWNFVAQSPRYASHSQKFFWSFAAQSQRYALQCLNLGVSFAAQGLHCALRYPPLRAGLMRYVAFLWEYYGNPTSDICPMWLSRHADKCTSSCMHSFAVCVWCIVSCCRCDCFGQPIDQNILETIITLFSIARYRNSRRHWKVIMSLY
jgi:hypothetical protein